MKELLKALEKVLKDNTIPHRVRDQVNELMMKLNSLARQGRGAKRQEKTPKS